MKRIQFWWLVLHWVDFALFLMPVTLALLHPTPVVIGVCLVMMWYTFSIQSSGSLYYITCMRLENECIKLQADLAESRMREFISGGDSSADSSGLQQQRDIEEPSGNEG